MRLEEVRQAASSRLKELHVEALTSNPPSWVSGSPVVETAAQEKSARSEHCLFFDHAGFLVLPGFADAATCQSMKDEMASLVQNEWHPDQKMLDSFGTNHAQNVQRGNYFLESADQVHFFAEPETLASPEKSPDQCPQLQPMYQLNKIAALNKAGHALHLLPDSAFQKYTSSFKLFETVTDLGWKDPVVPQSMYIFKQAQIGGAVHSHQDSTFLFTTPRQTCLGLWLALDDATLENGCLWVRPCSHWTDHHGGGGSGSGSGPFNDQNGGVHHVVNRTRRHYRRNVEHFGQDSIAARRNDVINALQPMFTMQQLIVDHTVPWDGGLPGSVNNSVGNCGDMEALLSAGFCPVECQAGDLVLFGGELDHLSLPNTSTSPRHTFQLHLVEGPSQGIEWSPYNWLQYPPGKPFFRLSSENDS
jgi:phytanoyl-CoA hydroxylase